MRHALAYRRIATSAVLLLTISCAACSPSPVVPSADVSCELFRPIWFSTPQVEAVKADYDRWESAVDQVVSHNEVYEKHCAVPK